MISSILGIILDLGTSEFWTPSRLKKPFFEGWKRTYWWNSCRVFSVSVDQPTY